MKTLLNCAMGIRIIYGLISILLTVGVTSCNLIPIVPPGSIKSVNVNLNIHFSGDHIVDPEGNSLYLFSHDVKGDSSVCTGDCLAEWPAFFDPNYPVAPPLKRSDFSTFTRQDGSKQTAYKGWPLYHFAGDKKPAI